MAIDLPTIEDDYLLTSNGPLALRSGGQLPVAKLRYTVYGKPSSDGSNVMLVPHALSGSSRVADWWPQLFGARSVFDLDRDCVIGINLLGSCYGSTGPRDINPATGRAYGTDFPLVTVGDNVTAQASLVRHLGLKRLRTVIGGSIGGMQALQWAIDYPEMVETCVAVGAAPLGAMALALNHLQRKAIIDNPADGLSLARQIAMCSYKSAQLFEERFGRNPNRNGEAPEDSLVARYDVAGYLDHQGDIFVKRFDPNSYLVITKLMDNFDILAGHKSVGQALSRIRAKVLLVGIESDWLFPVEDIIRLAGAMKEAGVEVEYRVLSSTHGHDGFLAEADELASLVRDFIHTACPAQA